MRYLENNGIAIKGAECNWGNFYDVSVDELDGYYTNVNSGYGHTDGFKHYTELENLTTEGTKNISILLTTGASEKVKKMNLYDIAGNLWEWTEEAAYEYNASKTVPPANLDYNTYMVRGGGFVNNGSIYKASFRFSSYAINTNTFYGFRVALKLM